MTGPVAFDRTGSGPPLVLLHGLGGERRVWREVVEHLRDEREVISVDLPGFGDSAPLPDDIEPTPWAIAEALDAFFTTLGVDRPHVAGNSLGGWVALELGKRGTVASVTGLCTAGLWSGPLAPKPFVMHRLARGLRPVLPALMRTELGRRAALSGIVARPDEVPARDALGVVRAYADAPAFVATNRAMRANWFQGGEHIRVPVTLGWGEHDQMVTRPRPGAIHGPVRHLVLEGCGHLPMLDDARQTAAVVLSGSDSTRLRTRAADLDLRATAACSAARSPGRSS
ncbi:alpha/beta fold hydrolase [Paraconexibacter sp.]|uniref:alpha/beta fold hydrolase n=1 Tax=Paraconexibacter sp. TaxID=2949640 RepID=UPI003561EB6C